VRLSVRTVICVGKRSDAAPFILAYSHSIPYCWKLYVYDHGAVCDGITDRNAMLQVDKKVTVYWLGIKNAVKSALSSINIEPGQKYSISVDLHNMGSNPIRFP
jgi:hypothetical protein